jgi:hypothetical protein
MVTLDDDGLTAIAAELRIRFASEPYRVGDAPVWGAEVAAGTVRPVRLVVWPSLGRVDLRDERWTIVFKDIVQIEIYAGVEVLFRRADGAAVFVTADGQVHLTL